MVKWHRCIEQLELSRQLRKAISAKPFIQVIPECEVHKRKIKFLLVLTAEKLVPLNICRPHKDMNRSKN